MLRQRLSAVPELEREDHPDVFRPEPAAQPGQPLPQRQDRASPGFSPKVERRRSERRGVDALRDEALQNLISQVEDRNFNGLRQTVPRRFVMPNPRLLMLVVAVIAGGLAAYFALQRQPPVMPVAAPAEIAAPAPVTTRVLVARAAIGAGQRLTPDALEWQEWPLNAVRAEYVTVEANPQAPQDMAGSLVRADIFAGEPIRAEKLAGNSPSLLAAILDEGKRGVSVAVVAESAAGGFVAPRDHVDVVLTRAAGQSQVSRTILHNVLVLAINDRLGVTGGAPAQEGAPTPDGTVFASAIATLALDPGEAELVINATLSGRLSLILRPVADYGEANFEQTANQAIRASSPFWTNGAGSGGL